MFLKNSLKKIKKVPPPRARKCDRGREKRRGGRKMTNFDVEFSSIFKKKKRKRQKNNRLRGRESAIGVAKSGAEAGDGAEAENV